MIWPTSARFGSGRIRVGQLSKNSHGEFLGCSLLQAGWSEGDPGRGQAAYLEGRDLGRVVGSFALTNAQESQAACKLGSAGASHSREVGCTDDQRGSAGASHSRD